MKKRNAMFQIFDHTNGTISNHEKMMYVEIDHAVGIDIIFTKYHEAQKIYLEILEEHYRPKMDFNEFNNLSLQGALCAYNNRVVQIELREQRQYER